MTDDELMLLSLIPFMDNSENVEQSILKTTYLITNIDDLDYGIAQFINLAGNLRRLCGRDLLAGVINPLVCADRNAAFVF